MPPSPRPPSLKWLPDFLWFITLLHILRIWCRNFRDAAEEYDSPESEITDSGKRIAVLTPLQTMDARTTSIYHQPPTFLLPHFFHDQQQIQIPRSTTIGIDPL
ncbi:uncharacterized protein G2W53_018948 [Senna tora]|uniref:Uncharacterized protein n=1 Tax=Senna tora TaxID=362788 RepID=A0A834TU25_9FABA|nr:uncharacterized protein G2W53_018948 [Senna tora]